MTQLGGIQVEWPDSALSPNFRGHWTAKAKSAKKARREAFWRASQFLPLRDRLDPKKPVILDCTFHPKTNRRRDQDNLVSMLKPYRDGIADVLSNGQDHTWETRATIGEKSDNPHVIIRICQ